jgi:predicted permease
MNLPPSKNPNTWVPDEQLVPLDKARNRLALLWLISAGVIFMILVIQSLRLVYGPAVQEVWGWILPTIMPTLGMIVTVLGYTALDPSLSDSVVRRTFFTVAFWLSFVYLCLIMITILIQPLSPGHPVDLMRMSNLWLGPFQGLVASAIGVLFVSKRPR